MALSFRRETAEMTPEALVFSDGFSATEALVKDLDTQFGEDQWLQVTADDTDNMLSIASAEDSFVIVALSSDDPEAVAATGQLIRNARECGLMVLLVCVWCCQCPSVTGWVQGEPTLMDTDGY